MVSPLDPIAASSALRLSEHRPSVGLILGSGLGDLADAVESPQVTSFADVPGLPPAGVAGHAGKIVVGLLAGRTVAIFNGRVHMYEGYVAAQVAFPVRILRALGCETLIVTNAAGGINPSFGVGDLMVIEDHLFLPGLGGANPLVAAEGDRFVSMVDAYDPALRELAEREALRLGFALRRGVYAMVSGPSYETSAELRFLRVIGADAVGMSTAPEVVVARQLGMRVLGISCITNQAVADAHAPLDHADVLAAGQEARPRFVALVTAVLAAF